MSYCLMIILKDNMHLISHNHLYFKLPSSLINKLILRIKSKANSLVIRIAKANSLVTGEKLFYKRDLSDLSIRPLFLLIGYNIQMCVPEIWGRQFCSNCRTFFFSIFFGTSYYTCTSRTEKLNVKLQHGALIHLALERLNCKITTTYLIATFKN